MSATVCKMRGLAQRRDDPAGRRSAGAREARRIGGSQAAPTVRRSAAARRAGPRDRHPAEGSAARRALFRTRRNLRASMQVEIKEIQRKLGVTTIFVTHDQSEALSLSDRIAVMVGRTHLPDRHAGRDLSPSRRPLRRLVRRRRQRAALSHRAHRARRRHGHPGFGEHYGAGANPARVFNRRYGRPVRASGGAAHC